MRSGTTPDVPPPRRALRVITLPGSTKASAPERPEAMCSWPKLSEGVDIELVVREDHKVLEVLRVGAGVVEKPVQRIVDARGTEQSKRLGRAGMPL